MTEGCDQSCIDNGMICDRCGQCIIHKGHASNACHTN